MAHVHEQYDFTVSAFILHPTEPKICLHNHKKIDKWLQPGGHVELDEDPLEALSREMVEETGLYPEDYTIIHSPNQPHLAYSKIIPLPFSINVHDFNDRHKHIDSTYLLKSKTEKLTPARGESQQIGWYALQQIIDLNTCGLVLDDTLTLSEWVLTSQST